MGKYDRRIILSPVLPDGYITRRWFFYKSKSVLLTHNLCNTAGFFLFIYIYTIYYFSVGNVRLVDLYERIIHKQDNCFPFSLDHAMSHSMSDHCKASLRVNDTLAMSGEQAAADGSSETVKKVALLYLGGIPAGQNVTAELPVTVGITGCISRLQVGTLRSICDCAPL